MLRFCTKDSFDLLILTASFLLVCWRRAEKRIGKFIEEMVTKGSSEIRQMQEATSSHAKSLIEEGQCEKLATATHFICLLLGF